MVPLQFQVYHLPQKVISFRVVTEHTIVGPNFILISIVISELLKLQDVKTSLGLMGLKLNAN